VVHTVYVFLFCFVFQCVFQASFLPTFINIPFISIINTEWILMKCGHWFYWILGSHIFWDMMVCRMNRINIFINVSQFLFKIYENSSAGGYGSWIQAQSTNLICKIFRCVTVVYSYSWLIWTLSIVLPCI
jgi:hypothetical protein